jgi:hypothetical protein
MIWLDGPLAIRPENGRLRDGKNFGSETGLLRTGDATRCKKANCHHQHSQNQERKTSTLTSCHSFSPPCCKNDNMAVEQLYR